MGNLIVVVDRNLEITIVAVELDLETVGAAGKRVAEVGLHDEEELTWMEVHDREK